MLNPLGKWSLLEVFAVALLCVLLKLGSVVRFQVLTGIYWFLAATAAGLGNAWWIRREGHRTQPGWDAHLER